MAENPTTKPIDPATLALAQAILTGGGGAGQPNVSLPPTQKYGMFKRTKEIDDAGITSDPGAPSPLTGYVYVLNPNYVEKPNAGPLQKMDDGALIRVNTDNTIDTIVPAAPKPQTLDQQTVTVNGRVYGVDPNNPTGDLIPRTAKDLTEDEAKKSADRARREQNQALTGHYATDDEMLDYTVKLNKAGVDKQAAQRDQAKFESDQRRLDADEARKAAAAPLDLAGKAATTAGTQATTQQTLQNLDINKAKLPGELRQQDLTAAGTEAATAASQQATATSKQAQQIAGAPQVQAPPTGMYTYTRNPLTGEVTQGGINAEYQAKTQAEVAARVGQIQSLMQAKQAEVQGKVGQTIAGKLYTADDALKDFNAWHAQNVQPQIGALQAAQQDAAFQQAKDQAAMRTQAYNAANAAGTQAISAFGAMQNGRVGPNFEAANQAASRGDFKALGNVQDATGYTAPDLTQTAPQAVMDALKYVDPTAARATGMPMPNYQNVDIGQTLGAMPYMPGGGAPPAPPPPPPPPPPAPEPVPAMAGARFKPGWPGSDPRLSGILDPTQFQQYFGNYSPGF